MGRTATEDDETVVRRTERMRDTVRDTRNITAKKWYMGKLEELLKEQEGQGKVEMIEFNEEGVEEVCLDDSDDEMMEDTRRKKITEWAEAPEVLAQNE